MEQQPTEGRIVFYYPDLLGDDKLSKAEGKEYAVAIITGIPDALAGMVNLTVFQDGAEPVVRKRIPKRPTQMEYRGHPVRVSYWDWPPRV